MAYWAVIEGILQLGSTASSMKGGQEAQKAGHAQSKAIKAQWGEEFRSMTLEEQATLGTQQARYAASGVDLGVGSVSTITQQTRDEYHRAVAAEAFQTQQRLKGAQTQQNAVKYAQVGNYFSSLASFASSINQYQQAKGG
jgi:hypothetical protein